AACASGPPSACAPSRTSSPRCACSAARPSSSDGLLSGIRPRCENEPVSGPTILELDLDLDAYAGPFDLLLALVLREELELVEVPIAEIVLTYIERLAEREEMDLEAVS